MTGLIVFQKLMSLTQETKDNGIEDFWKISLFGRGLGGLWLLTMDNGARLCLEKGMLTKGQWDSKCVYSLVREWRMAL